MIAAKTFQKLGLIFNSVEIVLNVAKSEQWCGVWYYSGSVVTANVVGPNKRNSDPISRSTSNATKSSARTMQASCCTRCNLDQSEKKQPGKMSTLVAPPQIRPARSTTTLLTPVRHDHWNATNWGKDIKIFGKETKGGMGELLTHPPHF